MAFHSRPIPCVGVALALVLSAPVFGAGSMRGGDTHMHVEELQLRVEVEDGYVTTEVEQVFRNRSGQAAEAVYDYPLPADAAFSGVTIWVDGKPIEGEVIARSHARAVYKKLTGVEVGKKRLNDPKAFKQIASRVRPVDPALAEAEGRLLRLRVSPVPAYGTKRVRIRYVQPLRVRGNERGFVYPLVLGSARSASVKHFSAVIRVRSRAGLDRLSSPSHPKAMRFELGAPGEAVARLDQKHVRLDRVLELGRWSPTPQYPRVEVVAAREDRGVGSVQLSLTPIVPPGRAKRSLLIAIDSSSSMARNRAAIHRIVEGLTNKLSKRDRVELVAFDHTATSCFGGMASFDRGRGRQISRFLNGLKFNLESDPRRLGPTVKRMARIASGGLDLVIVTDAELSRHASLLRQLEGPARDHGVRVFGLELGSGRVAQAPLAQLARRTGGAAHASPRYQVAVATRKLNSVLVVPVLRDPTLRFEGCELTQLSPARPPTALLSGQPLRLYARYTKPGKARAILEGRTPDGQRMRWSLAFTLPAKGEHLEVQRLWARSRADELLVQMAGKGGKERSRLERDLLAVSLAGPVLTRATSLIVLESEELFSENGIDRRNKARLTRERAAAERRRRAFALESFQARSRSEERLLASAKVSEAPSRRRTWSGPKIRGGSGGGAGDPFTLLLIAGGALAAYSRKRSA
ncbi:MAG: hypothetical protein JKY65_32890 [Planctomycetes bacterium]|nr:hypothetical protein [Planctomycetota bacterium]